MGKPGEYVAIEFSSADAQTAAVVTLKDADGATVTLAANERLLVDTLSANVAAAVTLVDVFADYDADGNVDAGERVASFGANVGNFDGGPEGFSIKTGFTLKVHASGAGQVDVSGTARIVRRGVDGDHRPSYKESLIP